MRTTQHLLVEATSEEGALARLAGQLVGFDSGSQKYKKIELVENDGVRKLTPKLLDEYRVMRWYNFEHVSVGLDLNRIGSGISAYGDDTITINGRLDKDIRSRFMGQVDKVIEIVTFVAERWHPYITVFDMENNSGDLLPVEDRLRENPEEQFVIDVKVTF